MQKSAQLASLNIEKAWRSIARRKVTSLACEAKETSEAIAAVLDGDSERVLAFSCPSGDDAWELQAMECGQKLQSNGEDVRTRHMICNSVAA